jgi:hypothetical protein
MRWKGPRRVNAARAAMAHELIVLIMYHPQVSARRQRQLSRSTSIFGATDFHAMQMPAPSLFDEVLVHTQLIGITTCKPPALSSQF